MSAFTSGNGPFMPPPPPPIRPKPESMSELKDAISSLQATVEKFRQDSYVTVDALNQKLMAYATGTSLAGTNANVQQNTNDILALQRSINDIGNDLDSKYSSLNSMLTNVKDLVGTFKSEDIVAAVDIIKDDLHSVNEQLLPLVDKVNALTATVEGLDVSGINESIVNVNEAIETLAIGLENLIEDFVSFAEDPFIDKAEWHLTPTTPLQCEKENVIWWPIAKLSHTWSGDQKNIERHDEIKNKPAVLFLKYFDGVIIDACVMATNKALSVTMSKTGDKQITFGLIEVTYQAASKHEPGGKDVFICVRYDELLAVQDIDTVQPGRLTFLCSGINVQPFSFNKPIAWGPRGRTIAECTMLENGMGIGGTLAVDKISVTTERLKVATPKGEYFIATTEDIINAGVVNGNMPIGSLIKWPAWQQMPSEGYLKADGREIIARKYPDYAQVAVVEDGKITLPYEDCAIVYVGRSIE